MAIPKKYKGKSFAEIADDVTNIYQDRHDPISKRGFRKIISDLKANQEYQRQKKQIEETNEQILNAESQGTYDQMTQPVAGSGQGVNVDIQEPQAQFKRDQSASYNSKFANGGDMYAHGGEIDPPNKTKELLDSLRGTDLEREAYDKYLMIDDPVSGKELPYGEFRKLYLGEGRPKADKYFQDQRLDYASPEDFIRDKFTEARTQFIKKNTDKVPFPEDFTTKVQDYQTKSRETEMMKTKMSEINKPGKERGMKVIDFNKGVDTESNKRIDEDIRKGIRNKEGDQYIDQELIDSIVNESKDGGTIYIKPSKRGTFTAAAKKRGMGVQEFARKVMAHKENYSPAMVKKANFARNASKWHEDGGDMNAYIDGGKLGTALQFVPALGNIAEMFLTKPEEPAQARTISNDFVNRLSSFKPRQQTFEDVDISDIERGITEASGRFTASNVNASRGNAGAFMSNELANQANLMKAIGDARLKSEMQNLQVDQLNAGEVARVDALNAQMATQGAAMDQRGAMFNAQQQTNADITDAQNRAAYSDRRSQLFNSALSGITEAGRLLMTNDAAGKIMGYDIYGNPVNRTAQQQEVDIGVTPLSEQNVPQTQVTGWKPEELDFAMGGFMKRLKKLKKKGYGSK